MQVYSFVLAPLAIAGLGFGTVGIRSATHQVVSSTSASSLLISASSYATATRSHDAWGYKNETAQWPLRSPKPISGLNCYRQITQRQRIYYNCWPMPASGSSPTDTSTATSPSSTGTTGSVTTSTGSTTTSSTSSGVQPLGVGGSWHLIFDDEFSNDSSLNTSKWTPYWFSNGSTSNGTTMNSSNVSVSGGTLNLALNGNTGGLVSTNGKFSYTYGFAQARIYLPPNTSGSQIANWPAFWTDGQSWPTDGEQDIMEGLGGSACYHFHDPSGGPGGCASGNYSGWHTFGANWQPGSVTYYYDGVKVGTIDQGITSSPMYLILENSDGSSGGQVVSPSTMKVQYVRVWQQ